MNDLENLRKRAKHLVRQHRDRSYVVADRIRRALPRFDGMSDHAVLDTDFALHDAQQVIAEELGFTSWAELKWSALGAFGAGPLGPRLAVRRDTRRTDARLKEAQPMSTRTPATEMRMTRALPVVIVTDFERAIEFYRDTLGFDVSYTYGEPPFWGEVRRDDVAFNLRHNDESPWLPGVRDDEQLLSIAITTTDAKALFLQYQDVGVDFQERLREKPWNAIEFVVRDPDGNLILFGSQP